MAKYRNLFVAAAVLAIVLPATSIAGLFGPCGFCGNPFAGCHCAPCETCHLAPAACTCHAAGTMTFRAQPLVTYEEVPRTEIRREAYVEQVPVTTYERVTETVYVPQQVTKLVPRTVLQPQTRYRDVAYQVTERIARTQVRYVPQTVAGCNACEATPMPAQVGITPFVPATPAAPAAADSAIPTMPSIQVPPQDPHRAVPEYDDTGWETVRPRIRTRPSQSGTPVHGTSFSRTAPSAATVWRSRF